MQLGIDKGASALVYRLNLVGDDIERCDIVARRPKGRCRQADVTDSNNRNAHVLPLGFKDGRLTELAIAFPENRTLPSIIILLDMAKPFAIAQIIGWWIRLQYSYGYFGADAVRRKEGASVDMDPLEFAMIPAKSVDLETGLLCQDDGCWTNWEPVRIGAGSSVACAQDGYRYRIALYRDGYDESLAREYCYDVESNWTKFDEAAASGEWLTGPCEFPEDCFVRITVQRVDGSQAVRPYKLGEMIDLSYIAPSVSPMPGWALEEADRVASRVESLRDPDDLVLLVLSDIHYSTGCIWSQTARNLRAVAARVNPDAIVQLGDVSDGMTPVDVTLSFVTRVLGDLERCGAPVYSCVGNHDTNYFGNNAERLGKPECALLYLGRDEPWYYVDFASARVRCLFLDSFEQMRKQRYGFSRQQLKWMRSMLDRTQSDWKIIVFSHVPPCAEIHYWSDTILNGPRMMSALEERNRSCPGSVLAFVHGHSHVDQVYRKHSFPIVSIGCAKFEDFEECKPEGSTTPKRQINTSSQDLWDVIVVKAREGKLHLVRFGAGEDREVAGSDSS